MYPTSAFSRFARELILFRRKHAEDFRPSSPILCFQSSDHALKPLQQQDNLVLTELQGQSAFTVIGAWLPESITNIRPAT
jgi:hypothetical protein